MSETTQKPKWRPPKPAYHTPQLPKSAKTLLLFLHGFMGSDSSFASFPSDLAAKLFFSHNISDIETRVYPAFESKGDHRSTVADLAAWLQTNAKCRCYRDVDDDPSAPEDEGYDGVVVLGHSMGGIFAVDAYCVMAGLIGKDGKPTSRSDLTGDSGIVPGPSKDEKLGVVMAKYNIKSSIPEDSDELQTESVVLDSNLKIEDVDRSKFNNNDAGKIESLSKEAVSTTENTTTSTSGVLRATGKVSAGAAWLGVAGITYLMGARKTATQMVSETVVETGRGAVSAVTKGAKSIIASFGSAEPEKLPDYNHNCGAVNIFSIIAFDSPFYGVHPRVIAITASTKAASTVTSYIPAVPESIKKVPSAVTSGVTAASKVAVTVASTAVSSSASAASIALNTGAKAMVVGTQAVRDWKWKKETKQDEKQQPVQETDGMSSFQRKLEKLKNAKSVKNQVDQVNQADGNVKIRESEIIENQLQINVTSSKNDQFQTDRILELDNDKPSEENHGQLDIDQVEMHLPENNADLLNKVNDLTTTSQTHIPYISCPTEVSATPATEQSQNMQENTITEPLTSTASTSNDSVTNQSPSDPLETLVTQIETTETQKMTSDLVSAEISPPGTKPSNEWYPWLAMGLTAAAIGGAAYYTGGLSVAVPFAQRAALAWALSHANVARKYLQFLSPVWSASTKELLGRLRAVDEEVRDGKMSFR
ncbi:hypothetical protein HK096_003129, partial [Nowakowskiella sp. JEL0078]